MAGKGREKGKGRGEEIGEERGGERREGTNEQQLHYCIRREK